MSQKNKSYMDFEDWTIFVSKSIASNTQRTSFTGRVHETWQKGFLCTSGVKPFCELNKMRVNGS